MDTNSVTVWYADKALWISAFAITTPFVAKFFNVSLDAGQMASLAAIVGTYVAAHKFKSGAVLLEETRQQGCDGCRGKAAP